ncbi:MAG: NRDE family protein [Cyclobacteriaceae bacterium]|nr:NRDE family protein [Cyclobacteriaceae bacterium]
MCLAFISINNHPQYNLIIAANRDEFYKRKTIPLAFWSDNPSIVGGRDIEARGTWMAMHVNGRVGLVTNYRDPAHIDPKAPSRGKLVTDFLESSLSPQQYLQQLEPHAAAYNGFNLLVGYQSDWYYLSNYKAGIQKLDSGIYGISNHLLDTPWPKVANGKAEFQQLTSVGELYPEMFFKMLFNETIAADATLPDTGVGLVRERALSAMFIKSPGYGTRCSTVLMIDKANRVLYAERTFNTETFTHSTTGFRFDIVS